MEKNERPQKLKLVRDRLLLKRLRQKIRDGVKKRLHIEEKKIRWEHVKKTTWALFLMVPYLMSEWTARAFNLYESFSYIDLIVHFSFGVAFVSIASLIYMKPARSSGLWLVITSFTWEALEKIGDAILSQPSYHIDIFFWDGVTDVLMNLLGGLLIYLILKKTGVLEHKI